MWNPVMYDQRLEMIKKEGNFNGKHIKSKSNIHEELAEALGFSLSTIKSWARKTSTGPGDTKVIERLEDMLGLPRLSLTYTELTPIERKESKNMYKLSDFTKSRIMLCYELIVEYLNDDDKEYEECFTKMANKVRSQKIAMPEEIYNKIENFIDQNIAPFIYEDTDAKFTSRLIEGEEFKIEEDGSLHLLTEKATKEVIRSYLELVLEMHSKTEEFGIQELQPLLCT